MLRTDRRELPARDRDRVNLLQLPMLPRWDRSECSTPREGFMTMSDCQARADLLWVGIDALVEQCDRNRKPVSYYEIAIGGRGRIDVRTGRLEQRGRRTLRCHQRAGC
jgi:hypothetical protein